MPLDDRLRTGLTRIADEVDPDVERGINRVLSTQPRSPLRRVGTVLAFAAAAGLGIAVVGLGAMSVLNRVGANPSPTASAEASSVSCRGGSCLGELKPGVGRSREFIPPIGYVIPPDSPVVWDNPEDLPGTFTLHPEGPKTDAIFFFRDVRVITPGCESDFDDSVGNTADEIAAWMTANKGLTTTDVRTVAIGGLLGRQLDIAASGTYDTVCPGNEGDTYPAGLPLLPLFAGAGSGDLTWFVGGDEKIRLYLLDMPGGGNLVIGVDAIKGDFDSLLEICQPVIDSITFDSDYY
jgi:hypothetical protein